MKDLDTIAAVATPWGEGGVGIVRLSGPASLDIALRLFRPSPVEPLRERYLYYGTVTGGADIIDNGFLVYMKSPRSYTGEDVVELQCHGGPLVLKKVLEALISHGARLAEPGEFTKRAFLNGKLDLAEAEAVSDLIRAETELSLSSARSRLKGELSAKVNAIKERVFSMLARLEAELDFQEDEVEGLAPESVIEGLAGAASSVNALLSTYEEGKALRDGVGALILGRPNVGKSSLLNILLKEERAIVTPHPGTTRDIIEEVVNIRGLPVRLMDTAGLRETTDHVEAIGVRLAKERIAQADLVLFVVDSASEDLLEDSTLLECAGSRKVIVVANKSDLAGPAQRRSVEEAFGDLKIVFCSALLSDGIEALKDAIFEEVAGRAYSMKGESASAGLIASIRHRTALQSALEGIGRARKAVEDGAAREFVATDLRWALDRLGEITGETTTDDILDRIFSEFCIGK